MEIITPIVDGRLEYIWYAHCRNKPWVSNVGELSDPRVENRAIKVDFTVTRKNAEQSARYDEVRDRVVLDVQDSEGHPITEQWLYLRGRDEITGTIGIREK